MEREPPVAAPQGRGEDLSGDLIERLKGVYEYALVQKKMSYYPLAGLALVHLRPGFPGPAPALADALGLRLTRRSTSWVLGPQPTHLPLIGDVPIGTIYGFIKDVTASLVLFGALVFVYYRVVKHESRMTLSSEGVLILGIILAMMLADMLYDGASLVLWHRCSDLSCAAGEAAVCDRIRNLTAQFGGPPGDEALGWHLYPNPAGSLMALVLDGAGPENLSVLATIELWVHSTLVLVFANLLPHSKHFHIITSIPNVFARDITPRGRLPFMGNSEKIGEQVMKAAEEPEKAEPVGAARIEDFTWKAILDFYTCTECGRCSDNCPAHKSGKILSPKQLTLDLRDHLYVDKIVAMRRNLVLVKGEFPAEAQRPLPGPRGQRQPVEPGPHRPRQLGRGLGIPPWPSCPRRPCSTGSAAPPATTIAPRRSPAPPPS